MKSKLITGLTSLLLVSLTSYVSGAALEVFVPPVTSPKAGNVWTSGTTQIITWDTSNAPVNITNREGFILLRKANMTTPLILAENFDILLGQISIVVPLVIAGADYQVILFGDSGNFSPDFTIKGSGISF